MPIFHADTDIVAEFLTPDAIDSLLRDAEALRHSAPHECERLTNQVMHWAEQCAYPRGQARAMRLRGVARTSLGRTDEAYHDFSEALEWSRILEDSLLEAQCLHGLGIVYFYRGNFDRAIEYTYRAIALWRKLGDSGGLGRSLSSAGAYHAEQGHNTEAAAYLTEALSHARQSEDRYTLEIILNNLGNIKELSKDWESASTYYAESVEVGEAIGDQVLLPIILSNLANAYIRQNHPEQGLTAAKRAMAMAETLGNDQHTVRPLLSLALAYHSNGMIELAEQTFEATLALARAPVNTSHLTSVLMEYANFYKCQGRIKEALPFLEEAIHAEEGKNRLFHLIDLHQGLAELYEAEGNLACALHHQKRLREVEQQKEQRSATTLLIARMAKVEVERARQETEYHRLRSQELAEANAEKENVLRQWKRHATEDALTGLFNRRYLNDYLQTAVHQSRQNHAPLVIAIADLDNFKQINDRLLHATGDIVLRTVANILRSGVRESDIVARFGGEEFALVFPGLHRGEAFGICERIRLAIAAYDWKRVHPQLSVTVSIGIAAERSETSERLLDLADKRLYHAKETGKNRVVCL